MKHCHSQNVSPDEQSLFVLLSIIYNCTWMNDNLHKRIFISWCFIKVLMQYCFHNHIICYWYVVWHCKFVIFHAIWPIGHDIEIKSSWILPIIEQVIIFFHVNLSVFFVSLKLFCCLTWNWFHNAVREKWSGSYVHVNLSKKSLHAYRQHHHQAIDNAFQESSEVLPC